MFNKTIFFILVLALFYGCGGGGETTTGSTDTTPPTVFSTSPGSFADGVAVNSTITATFNEVMTASTITADTFTLNNGATGTVTYSGTTATFTPSSNLIESTNYLATITTGVKDAAGNAMAADFTWRFTTGTITTVSFASEIQPIFTSSCISCHQTGGISSFLPLTTGVSYNNLVNQTSTYTTGGTLVIPGNSADSVLYKRISGNTVGLQMPRLLAPLSTSDQNLIQTWIDEGANNN